MINSQDYSKGLNKGEKIGQPMINFKRYLDIGDLDLYLLYPCLLYTSDAADE